MDFILALDQGTTNTTTLLIDQNGTLIADHSEPHPQHYPKEGYVEHYDFEIKSSIKKSIENLLQKSKINKNQIAAIGITNQRETLCVFDDESRQAHPFIVWQCRRSQNICERLKKAGLEESIRKKTGLVIDPYFTATKILWLFENFPEIKQKVDEQKLKIGTIDTFVAHWLSSGSIYATDVTNASRTMLLNIDSLDWDEECLKLFMLKKENLPKLMSNCEIYGYTKNLSFLPDGIPIASLMGDQQAALFAQGCLGKSDAKATFGTGCFILLNTGEEKILSQHGLLTSIAYKINNQKTYCLEGSAFIGGSAVNFLYETLGVVNDYSEVEALVNTVASSEGALFVPALCGLGSPQWNAEAKGLLVGLTKATTKAHIARAVLEGVALQNEVIFDAMQKDGISPTLIKADGGAVSNNAFMQLQADITNIPFAISSKKQQTGLGAAYLAGITMGFFDIEKVKSFNKTTKSFTPKLDENIRNKLIQKYHAAVNLSISLQ